MAYHSLGGKRKITDLKAWLLNKIKIDENGCWIWQGTINDQGYGFAKYSRKEGKKAHRLAYEQFKGPIPEGLDLDHLCRNRACVNPDHLEAVTRKENVLRGEGMGARYARRTHCKNGHELIEENLLSRKGARHCKLCKRLNEKKRRAKKKIFNQGTPATTEIVPGAANELADIGKS